MCVYALLLAPNPPTLSGLKCYACLGIQPEDCTPEKSRQVQCHHDQSVCFQGNGQMTVGEGLGAGQSLPKGCEGRAGLTGRHGPGLKESAWPEGRAMALL